MKGRTLALLLVAAIAAVGGAVYFWMTDQALTAADANVGQKLYPELAGRLNAVTGVTLARKDGTLTLTRGDQGWRLTEKSNYPVAFERVRKLLVDLAEMRTIEPKTSSAAVYGSLDVEDLSVADAKSVVITLRDAASAQIASVIVGKTRAGRGGPASDATYVRKSGEAQAWLVSGRIQPDKEPERWLERRVADIGRERVREATVVQADGTRLVVRRDKPSDADFTLVDAPADRPLKSAFERNSIGSALELLDFDDVRPASEVKFADNGPRYEAKTFDGETVTLDLTEVDGKTWARLGARYEAPAQPVPADDPGAAKLKSAAEATKEAADLAARATWAYRLPDYKAEPMKKKLEDLLEAKPAAP